MKRRRFTTDQIIGILIEHVWGGFPSPIFAASMASAMRPFANGKPDKAPWMSVGH